MRCAVAFKQIFTTKRVFIGCCTSCGETQVGGVWLTCCVVGAGAGRGGGARARAHARAWGWEAAVAGSHILPARTSSTAPVITAILCVAHHFSLPPCGRLTPGGVPQLAHLTLHLAPSSAPPGGACCQSTWL